MKRLVLIVALLVAVLESTAAAAVGVRWGPLGAGSVAPSGARHAVGYVAVTKAQEARLATRLDPTERADLETLNLEHTAIVAIFLDDVPCGQHIAVTHVVRSSSTVTVALYVTRPATCVHRRTPYVLIGVSRASFGHPAPAHVKIVALARA